MNSGNKNIVLTIASCLFILLFLGSSIYKVWFKERVINPIKDVHFVVDYPKEDDRKHIRLGKTYTMSHKIAEYLRANHQDTNALLLLPPNALVKELKFDYPIPEPMVFYYYTGIKSVWANSTNAAQATHAVIFTGHDMHVLKVSGQELKNILDTYKKYPITL